MAKIIQGDLSGKGLKIGIVAARFNDFITSRLVDGALDGLQRHGVAEADIEIVRVPGAYEIPLAARMLAQSRKFQAVICLGAVIRGATPHFEYVSAEVSKGVASVSLETGLPVIFGVLTTDTIEQAIERAGTKSGNKGWDAAISAIEMANAPMRRTVTITAFSLERAYQIRSISPGRQVLSNHGSSGPYSRNTTNQPLPGIVCTQLVSFPEGASGPK